MAWHGMEWRDERERLLNLVFVDHLKKKKPEEATNFFRLTLASPRTCTPIKLPMLNSCCSGVISTGNFCGYSART